MEKNFKNVLVTLPDYFPGTDNLVKQAKSIFPQSDFTVCTHDQIDAQTAREADIWIGNPPMSLLRDAGKLSFLQLITAGADYYCADPFSLPRNMTLANASGAFGLTISEHMIAVMLMMMRGLHINRDNQLLEKWAPPAKQRSVFGSAILIVGLGDIGSNFAKRAKAMGAYLIGVKRTPGECPEWLDEQHTIDKLDQLLPRADVVALCVPSTAHTKRFFDKERMERMKPDSYLINVGRGDAVDARALSELLHEGKLAGAALDVTDPEPLPQGHPLWKEPNALITPHCSGNYLLQKTIDIITDIVIGNLTNLRDGKPLKNVVDLSTGYRAPNL